VGWNWEHVENGLEWVSVRVSWEKKVAEVSLKRQPANALDHQLWSELKKTLEWLDSQFPAVRVAIIRSGLPERGPGRNLFSAGNDLTELDSSRTTKDRFVAFWRTLSMFLASLYRSKLYTIASIHGFCAAGGLAIALACDSRIASPDASMGLNEAQLGIPAPTYWAKLLERVVGYTTASRMLTTGEMIRPPRALEAGLVDCVSSDVGKDVLDELALKLADDHVSARGAASADGFALNKAQLRDEFAREWEQYSINQEPELSWQLLDSSHIRQALHAAMAALSASKKQRQTQTHATKQHSKL